MPQPPFHYEGEDKPDCCDTAANDEKRFEYAGPNVGYVHDIPFHTDVLRSPLSEPSDEHCKQCAFPHKSCEDWNPYIVPVGVAG